MSLTITSSSYKGEFSGKYIAASLLAAKTIDDGVVTVLPNIKHKSVMKVGAFSNLIKNSTCGFDQDSSGLTLTEKVLTVKELQVNLDICTDTLVEDWEAAQMGFSAFHELPPNFSDFVIARVGAEVASATETAIWSGTDSDGSFAGLKAQIQSDGNRTLVSATDITSSNVVAEMAKVVDAIPSSIYGNEDLYIYCASNVFRAYVRALGGFGANGVGANGVENLGNTFYQGGALSFDGVKLYPTSGMGSNEMIAARSSNLFFGTSLLSDYQEVRTLNMAEIDGSQNYRIIMRYTAGTQIGVGSDIVIYT
tara:strand:- start:465 stop:1388 length:924 start_codon:yes stop_codon:yes gene_type:complete